MRFLITILFLVVAGGAVGAAPAPVELQQRLRLMLPGDEPAVVNERQFLYQRFNLLFDELVDRKAGRKRTKKRIRRITDHLRDRYLRTYDPAARLADAFRTGRYNDATAALLTALSFERFDVLYEGYVDYWEVYLVADPDGKRAAVRPPGQRSRNPAGRANFRRDYLELIRTSQTDDLADLTEDGTLAVFARYYYDPTRRLSFGQLTAFLLYRRAQAAYRAGDFPLAVDLLDQALDREARPAFTVLRNAAVLELDAITAPTVEDETAELLAQWAEAPTNKYLPAAILQLFDARQRKMIAAGRLPAARELLDDYLARAPAGSLAWANAMTDLHQLRALRYRFQAGQLPEARRLAEALYARYPDNPTIEYLLGEIVIDGLRRTRGRGETFTTAAAAVAERYPFVKRQDRFADLYLREAAWRVRDAYATDDGGAGAVALAEFKDALLGVSVDERRSLWTLTAFIAASNYHFRQKEYDLARYYVGEGLKYNRKDPYLLHRQELLQRY